MPRSISKWKEEKQQRERERGACIRHAVIQTEASVFTFQCFPKPRCRIHRQSSVWLEFGCVLHEHSPSPHSLTSDSQMHTHKHRHTLTCGDFQNIQYTPLCTVSQTEHCAVEIGLLPVFSLILYAASVHVQYGMCQRVTVCRHTDKRPLYHICVEINVYVKPEMVRADNLQIIEAGDPQSGAK